MQYLVSYLSLYKVMKVVTMWNKVQSLHSASTAWPSVVKRSTLFPFSIKALNHKSCTITSKPCKRRHSKSNRRRLSKSTRRRQRKLGMPQKGWRQVSLLTQCHEHVWRASERNATVCGVDVGKLSLFEVINCYDSYVNVLLLNFYSLGMSETLNTRGKKFLKKLHFE